jgi:4-amino-4-deoxy-L-arabinose transferase-like glycosyltransferase
VAEKLTERTIDRLVAEADAGRDTLVWDAAVARLVLRLRSGSAPLLLGLGMALMAAMLFPAHDYIGNADQVLHGLFAFRVLRGEHPVFVVKEYWGALGGYVTALLFWLFGVSRASLAGGPLLCGALTLVAWYGFLRETLGRRLALIALPFATFPSPAFLFWTTLPNGYPPLLLLVAASLWLAAQLARGDGSRWTVSGFGLCVGLAWWTALLSVECTVPAVLWVAWRRRDLLHWRPAARFVTGFLLGALPWLAYNIRHPLHSFLDTTLIQPAAGWQGKLDNVRFLAQNVRELIASRTYEWDHPRAVTGVLQWPVLILVGLAALASLGLFPLWRYLRRRQGAGLQPMEPGAPVPLIVMMGTMTAFVNVVSVAGHQFFSVRYLLPLYFVVPAVIAPALAALASRSRAAATACAATIIVFNLAGASLPGTAVRRELETQTRYEDQLLAFLRGQHIDAVAGTYWEVYPIAFLSRERILPIPNEADYFRMDNRLPSTPVRWALVASRPEDLAARARRAGLHGTIREVTPAAHVFLPEPDPPACTSAELLQRLKAAY